MKVPEGYVAFVEELPGANTQGNTLKEARANLKEAVTIVLEANRELSEQSLDNGINSGIDTRESESCPAGPGKPADALHQFAATNNPLIHVLTVRVFQFPRTGHAGSHE